MKFFKGVGSRAKNRKFNSLTRRNSRIMRKGFTFNGSRRRFSRG